MRNLRDKKVLITGAASGIGRAIALALASKGAHLYLLDVDDEQLSATAGSCRASGVEVVTAHCDLCESAEIASAMARLLDHWGGVDVVINNAGIGYYGKMEKMPEGYWERILAVNLHAPIAIIQTLLPSLLQREQSHVVNVCSLLGLVAWRRMTAYQTTKFALVGFSRSLRAEYVRSGMGVTCLCPGFVHTNIFEAARQSSPKGKIPSPPWWLLTDVEHVAAAAVKGIRRNRATVIVPFTARVSVWLDRLLPSFVDFLQRTPWRARRSRHLVLPAGKSQVSSQDVR